jgi:hypothetical protein
MNPAFAAAEASLMLQQCRPDLPTEHFQHTIKQFPI